MAKTRVYELARELKIESKQLVTRIKSAGIEINSHQSTLTPSQVEDIRKLMAGEQVEIAKPKKRVVIRRRKKAEPEPEAAPEVSAEPADADAPEVAAKTDEAPESVQTAEAESQPEEVAQSGTCLLYTSPSPRDS